jgi:hypothetical protein
MTHMSFVTQLNGFIACRWVTSAQATFWLTRHLPTWSIERTCIFDEHESAESIGQSAAQRLVAEMREADQRSDGFRFPTDRDGAPFAFGDRGIDLANIREVMQGLVNFFECAYLDLSHQDHRRSEAT